MRLGLLRHVAKHAVVGVESLENDARDHARIGTGTDGVLEPLGCDFVFRLHTVVPWSLDRCRIESAASLHKLVAPGGWGLTIEHRNRKSRQIHSLIVGFVSS